MVIREVIVVRNILLLLLVINRVCIIMAETVEIPLTICQSMVITEINADYGDYTNQKQCDYAKVVMREVMVVMKYSYRPTATTSWSIDNA